MTIRAFIQGLDGRNYLESIQDGLAWIDFGSMVSRNSRIFIKPNLTFPTYRPGVMTSPEVIEAAIVAIKDYTPDIYIGDSDSGGYNRFSMDDVYAKIGVLELAKKYGVKVVNLSKLERRNVSLVSGGRVVSFELPLLLTDDIDMLVTMPVPKMHANTMVSLTFKNQWGCIPEPSMRLRLHPYLKDVLLEVNRAVKAKISIIDGKYGLSVNGPMRGKPIKLNWLLMTNQIGAGARLACELMRVPIDRVPHLQHAKKRGLIPDLEDIKINQDYRQFIKEKFVLRRNLMDYPGYFAFHSAFLAYLAYFSPAAELLHRILYLFREPFYEYKH